MPNRLVTSRNGDLELPVRARIPDVGEQQRRTARRDHAAMDFGGFEVRIDRRLHRDDVAVDGGGGR